MKVVLDAMGGDNAPHVPVMGAVQAAKEFGIKVILVGDESQIKKELSKYSFPIEKIEIVHADDVVSMDELPSKALKKKNSSLHIGTKLLKDKLADAFVSAGNTGAVMAISLFTLGRLKGVERPAISTILPSLSGKTFLLDVGANVDCKPVHLLQFAIMGEAYAKYVLKEENPKVGLLNIGEEEVKGNDLTKEAYKLLKAAREKGLNFIGNAEGRDIYSGKFDVIVCDGFVGNVALKLSESLAKILAKILKEEIESHFISKLGAITLKPAIKSFKKRIDYAEWGGAPLLGVKAPVIIAHGSSNAKAIKNAVKVASQFAESYLNEHIEKNIERYGKLNGY
ncbi:Phosphate acyltransferase [Desulfurobacterium thermolithotrophum DSM 11699]|uniref:Phosphate acyltransferase n=1 Tax=Desulfurobacterium thermolithotrophum (strain DSM 11699 / BSA) TaxID=868864 RepID=F0S3V1_DESTD|nr:phosphate acyltransferase PlsX [Desulfurobacterium thermolithotrophum]ADY73523.1 Phosphate acyltransferase [Desulfurobacterium thermolithotrophum DSM 11699]